MIEIEEVEISNIDEFWNQHVKYLVEDHIIDIDDMDYFSGNEYRDIIKSQMQRVVNKHHMIYFNYNKKRIGAA